MCLFVLERKLSTETTDDEDDDNVPVDHDDATGQCLISIIYTLQELTGFADVVKVLEISNTFRKEQLHLTTLLCTLSV